ncbi:hypothetical protein [Marinobacter sp. VGCF2001]|uniref:hypothetical protein n=1 Tax=Marinobacter sp. VGCF2001 TaxID=3417189 RepID=UPI003CF59CA7
MKFCKSLALFMVLAFSQAVTAQGFGGFESYGSGTKSLLNTIVDQLGINDPDNSVKMKVFDTIDVALESNWYSYWVGMNDLASSQYENGAEKGFLQVLLPTTESGIWILTFNKARDVPQIIISMAQIRHGSQDGALSVYNEKKNDSQNYEVKNEADTYAFIQEKGKVAFTLLNVGTGTGSVVYFNQFSVDL